MTTTPSLRARAAHLAGPVAASLAAGMLLAGCSGSDEAAPAPKPSATTSAAATPTPTPTPSPVTSSAAPVPTSPFEDRGPVKASRKWARALGRAVNQHDSSMRSLGGTVTERGRDAMKRSVADDLEARYTWPGPQPFTPVHVGVKGTSAKVDTCLMTRGWSVDPATGDRVASREVAPLQIRLLRQAGRWKVDGVFVSKGDCGGVKVVEQTW